jgi:hypothetical protein
MATVLRTATDEKVRIPNRLLVESVVRIHGADEPAPTT